MTVLPATPPFPLRASFVRRSSAAIAGYALFALLSLVSLGWSFTFAAAIRDDADLWSRGQTGLKPSAEGQLENQDAFFDQYNLNVTWHDAQGHAYRAPYDFFVAFSPDVRPDEPLVVRFDPRRPDHCVLNWAIDRASGRWAAFALLSLAAGAGAIAFAVGAWRSSKTLRNVRRLARGGELVALPIVSVHDRYRHRVKVATRYVVRRPGAAKPLALDLLVKKGKARLPLLAGPSRAHVLALQAAPEPTGENGGASAPAAMVVLESDLYPFDLDERVAADTRAAAAAMNLVPEPRPQARF